MSWIAWCRSLVITSEQLSSPSISPGVTSLLCSTSLFCWPEAKRCTPVKFPSATTTSRALGTLVLRASTSRTSSVRFCTLSVDVTSAELSFTVDLTMQVSSDSSPRRASVAADDTSEDSRTNYADEERAIPSSSSGLHILSHSSEHVREDSTELQTRPNSINEGQGQESLTAENRSGSGAASAAGNYIKRKTSQLLDVFSSSSTQADVAIHPQLAQLVQAYASSQIAADIRADILHVSGATTTEPDPTQVTRDIVEESSSIRGRRRASYATQFRILSGRAFKNLYRNPALLTAHYVSSLAIARESVCIAAT